MMYADPRGTGDEGGSALVPEDVPAGDPSALEPRGGPSEARIAGALSRLDDLADTPPGGHVDVYEQVHRVLQDVLAAARDGAGQDSDPRPGGPRP